MNNDFAQLIAVNLTAVPADDLLTRVLARLDMEIKLRAVRRRLAVFGLAFFAALVVLVPAMLSLADNLNSSGFIQYSSLLFYDWQSVLSMWQSFGYSLLESLPIFSLVIVLAAILALLESTKYLVNNLVSFKMISRAKAV